MGAARGLDDAGLLEQRRDPLQVGERQRLRLRDRLERDRLAAAVEAELDEQPDPVLRLGREDHPALKPTNEVGVLPDSVPARWAGTLDPAAAGRSHRSPLPRRVRADGLARRRRRPRPGHLRARCSPSRGCCANDDDIGYLLKTMRNMFYDERRQAARRATDPVDPEDFERVEGRGRAGRGGRAARAAGDRSPRCRRSSATCWSPSTWRGCPTRRRPNSLGVPEGTVMSRLYRARKRVIEAYEG